MRVQWLFDLEATIFIGRVLTAPVERFELVFDSAISGERACRAVESQESSRRAKRKSRRGHCAVVMRLKSVVRCNRPDGSNADGDEENG